MQKSQTTTTSYGRAEHDSLPHDLCGYQVQFVMAVDNPVNNVRRKRVQGGYLFEVPVNFPGCERLTYTQLIQLTARQ